MVKECIYEAAARDAGLTNRFGDGWQAVCERHNIKVQQNIIKVIIKWEGGKNGNPVLFFPEYSANSGNIVCYAHMGQHSEASQGYYAGLKNCLSPLQKSAASVLFSEYQGNNPDDVFKVVKRDTQQMRAECWKGL